VVDILGVIADGAVITSGTVATIVTIAINIDIILFITDSPKHYKVHSTTLQAILKSQLRPPVLVCRYPSNPP
jgi:hypothetical protein